MAPGMKKAKTLALAMTFQDAPSSPHQSPHQSPPRTQMLTRATFHAAGPSGPIANLSRASPRRTRVSQAAPRPSQVNRKSMAPASPDQTLRSTVTTAVPSSPEAASPKLRPRSPPRRMQRPNEILNGAHYQPCGEELLDVLDVPDRRDHDEMLSDNLHKRRPSDMPHPGLSSPKLPMRAAFTDRAAKLREGRGMRKTLMHEPHAKTDWFTHGECFCDVCSPNEAKGAGCASHEVHSNKLNRSHKDSHPARPEWEAEPVARTFNSELMTNSMIHAKTHSPPPPREEEDFARSMGRKIGGIPRPRAVSPPGSTGVLMHRSMSADCLQAAGCYNKDYQPYIMSCKFKARQLFQSSCKDLQPHRHGVAMAISPRADDPPAPTKIVFDKRGDGMFKHGLSPEVEGHIKYHNMPVFRFSESEVVYGRNSPSPDYESHCGLTTKGFEERFHRQQPSSPKFSPRALLHHNSSLVSNVINHDLTADLFAAEAADRSINDPAFKSLCEYTSDTHREVSTLRQEVKRYCGRSSSVGVASQLAWDDE